MVLAKLENSIIHIRGRCGGVYFKRGSPGQHIQAMPRRVRYARSPLQSPGISGYSAFAGIWMLALLGFWALPWAGFALAYHFTDKRGERKHISGYNWYIHYCLTFPETDEPHFWKPPHSPYDLPNYICSAGVSWHYRQTPDEWPKDYPAGYYWKGTFPWHGKPFYKTDDLMWYLWWKEPNWILSPGLDFIDEQNTYYSPDEVITAWYKNPFTNKLVHVYIGKR